MMPTPAPLILDEQDFEEIDRLLEALGADDGLRAWMAPRDLPMALIVGPQDVGPEDWLPVILGGEPLGAHPRRNCSDCSICCCAYKTAWRAVSTSTATIRSSPSTKA